MAYSYDNTLNVQYNVSVANVNLTLATSMAAEGGKRTLEGAVVLGVFGVGGATGGAVTLNFGDGTNDTRYGTFVADTVVTGQPVTGTLTLTEEGYHMGVSNDATTPQTFTIKGVGPAIITGGIVVGYY